MAIWYILGPTGKFYGHLVHFMVIWYILWSFGIIFPVLLCCTTKNLATQLGPNLEKSAKIEINFMACVAKTVTISTRLQGCQMFWYNVPKR
jgi:hypothetical protein